MEWYNYLDKDYCELKTTWSKYFLLFLIGPVSMTWMSPVDQYSLLARHCQTAAKEVSTYLIRCRHRAQHGDILPGQGEQLRQSCGHDGHGMNLASQQSRHCSHIFYFKCLVNKNCFKVSIIICFQNGAVVLTHGVAPPCAPCGFSASASWASGCSRASTRNITQTWGIHQPW